MIEKKKQQARGLIEAAKSLMQLADDFNNVTDDEFEEIKQIAKHDKEIHQLEKELDTVLSKLSEYV